MQLDLRDEETLALLNLLVETIEGPSSPAAKTLGAASNAATITGKT